MPFTRKKSAFGKKIRAHMGGGAHRPHPLNLPLTRSDCW